MIIRERDVTNDMQLEREIHSTKTRRIELVSEGSGRVFVLSEDEYGSIVLESKDERMAVMVLKDNHRRVRLGITAAGLSQDERQQILGDEETTAAMNREGL